MEQQNIQYNCGPKDHQPVLAFYSNASLVRSPTPFSVVIIIFRAAQEASVEAVPWCASFIGTAVEASMQMVQPFQLLFFVMHISGQDFSLSLHESKRQN
jgi:hypothetical protein